MHRMIFINLPVRDLPRSTAFYEALGFPKNELFSDGSGSCMVVSETINVMLLTHEKWRTFTDRPIPEASSSEVMLARSCESREQVDTLNSSASEMGGLKDVNPVQDLGFLYNRSFADPDGHVWEAVWMDPAAMPG